MTKTNKSLEIYAQIFLNDIKNYVRLNRVEISGEKEIETDKKMLEIIKDLCKQHDNETGECTFKAFTSNDEEESKRNIKYLMLCYMALYNDNIELLYYLLSKDYKFPCHGNPSLYPMGLFVLDRRLSSKFNKELYYELLTTQLMLIDRFYFSLGRKFPETTLSDDEIINIFCSILNKNPNVAVSADTNQDIIVNLLTKASIVYFGEEIILGATEKQKVNIISHVSGEELEVDTLERLRNLMTNYGFATLLTYHNFTNAIFNEFTDEELLKIDKLEGKPFVRHAKGPISKYGSLPSLGEYLDLKGLRKEINSKSPQDLQQQNKPFSRRRLRDFFLGNKRKSQ